MACITPAWSSPRLSVKAYDGNPYNACVKYIYNLYQKGPLDQLLEFSPFLSLAVILLKITIILKINRLEKDKI